MRCLCLLAFAIASAAPAVAVAQSDAGAQGGGDAGVAPGDDAGAGAGGGAGASGGAADNSANAAGGAGANTNTNTANTNTNTNTANTNTNTNTANTNTANTNTANANANANAAAAAAPAAAAPAAAAAPPAAERPPEDDGRSVDFLFIQPEAGLSYVDLTALATNGRLLPTLRQQSGIGYGFGATVGFRSSIVAVAAHGYLSRFGAGTMSTTGMTSTTDTFDVGQLMAEVQLRIPLPIIEPYARAGLGYAWLGNVQVNEMYRMSTSTVHGWTMKLGAGLDVWLGRFFTIGAGLDVTVTNLRRGGIMRADSECPMTMPTCVELSRDGDAFGLLAHLHVQAGLHF